MSGCPYGHSDCPLLPEKNSRIAGMVVTLAEVAEEDAAHQARIVELEAQVRKLHAELARLRRLGPNPLRRP